MKNRKLICGIVVLLCLISGCTFTPRNPASSNIYSSSSSTTTTSSSSSSSSPWVSL